MFSSKVIFFFSCPVVKRASCYSFSLARYVVFVNQKHRVFRAQVLPEYYAQANRICRGSPRGAGRLPASTRPAKAITRATLAPRSPSHWPAESGPPARGRGG